MCYIYAGVVEETVPIRAGETRTVAQCPRCQAEIDAEDRFCRGCGASLAEARPGRFKSILPTENLEGYRQNYFRPFFVVCVVCIAGLFGIAVLVHLIRAYLGGP